MRSWVHVLAATAFLAEPTGFFHACEPVALAQAENQQSPTVVVHADEAHGPLVTQLLEAIIKARVEGVTVVYAVEPTEAEKATSNAGERIVFSLDSSSEELWVLHIHHGRRRWVRRVPGAGQDAAAEEAVAQIVGTVSIELLSSDVAPPSLAQWEEAPTEVASGPAKAPVQEQSQAEKDEAPRFPPESKPHDMAEQTLGLQLGAGYRGEPYAPSVFTHGGFVSVDLRARRGFLLSLRGAFMPPVKVESEPGEFRIYRVPLQLSSGWCFGEGKQHLCPHAGLQVDPTVRASTVGGDAVSSAEPSTIWSWGGVAGVRADRKVASSVWLSADLSVAAFLMTPEYRAGGVEEPLLAPYPVRARLDLGLVFPMF